MLFSFINEMFNFCNDNVIGKLINEILFYFLSSLRMIFREKECSLDQEISVL